MIVIPKPDKAITKKELQINISHDVKILNKVLTNRIQKYIKITTHHDQVKFIPGIQGWLSI